MLYSTSGSVLNLIICYRSISRDAFPCSIFFSIAFKINLYVTDRVGRPKLCEQHSGSISSKFTRKQHSGCNMHVDRFSA